MVGRRVLNVCTLLALFISESGHAVGELRSLYFGARSKAMGGAYVGLADDEQTIFLNPAGLAGIKNQEVHYLPLDIDLLYDIYTAYTDSADAFSSFDATAVNALMGKNVYGRMQWAPSLMIPNFGAAVLVDGQAAFYARNQAAPDITFGWQNTNGLQLATGWSLKGGRRRRGNIGTDFRLGVGTKLMWRRGGYRKVPLITLFNISEGKSLINDLSGDYGLGIGLDLGSHFIHQIDKNWKLGLGLVYTDVGDTSFQSGEPERQRGNLTLGSALTYTHGILKVNLLYDYSHILEDTDWRQKNHFGLEIVFPTLHLYAGINQAYFTGGATLDWRFFKFTALTYGQEIGTFVFQDPSRRYAVKFDFVFEL